MAELTAPAQDAKQFYAARPWLKTYPPGMPHSLEPYPEMTLLDFLRSTARQFPDRPALTTSVRLPFVGHRRHSLTFSQLDRASDALAAALVDKGLQKGQNVTLLMPNVTAYVIAYYAVQKAGGVSAALNPTYPALKLQHLIDYADSEFALTITSLYGTLKSIQSQTKLKHIIVTNVKEYLSPLASLAFTYTQEKAGGHRLKTLEAGDYWMQDLLKRYRGKKADIVVTPDDLAFMQYTGGITGVYKGAMATHRALANSTLMSETVTHVDWPAEWNVPPHDEFRIVAALPMFHVFGLIVLLSQAIASGWEALMVADARDTDGLVDLIDTYQPHILLAVPALYSALCHHPRVTSGEVSYGSFVYALSAASPMSHDLPALWQQAGGRNLVQGYGLSEVPTGNHAIAPTADNRIGSVGPPLVDVDCRIVDVETGEIEYGPHQDGEVILNTHNMMECYYRMPDETDMVMRQHDGKTFVYTGDIGHVDDDGYLYLTGRKKEMAIIGGFNVYPVNVEDALKLHPEVADAGVWYSEHPRIPGMEQLNCFIVRTPGSKVDKAELIAHGKLHLAPYEVPRNYKFVDSLPYDEHGKLQRRSLG